MKRIFVCMGAALVAAACSEAGEAEVTPEVLNERRAAHRQACVARELAAAAADDLATIEQVAGAPGDDPIVQLQRNATLAALEYARAYQLHADLREAAYAYVDSAANYAAAPADSVRYLERSNAFVLRAPRPGSIEENVIRSYQRDMVDLLEDENHSCNWDIPF